MSESKAVLDERARCAQIVAKLLVDAGKRPVFALACDALEAIAEPTREAEKRELDWSGVPA